MYRIGIFTVQLDPDSGRKLESSSSIWLDLDFTEYRKMK